jgi:hypothetical protein
MIQRATIEAFDVGTYTAVLSLKQSHSLIANVPCSTAINSALLIAGAQVAVALFDSSNPSDALVLGVFQ